MPNLDIDKLQKKAKRLKEKIGKVEMVAFQKPIETTEYKDLVAEYNIPPFAITKAFTACYFALYGKLTDNTYPKKTTKFGTAVKKCISGIGCAAIAVATLPVAIVLDAPLSLAQVTFASTESAVYKTHNQRIDKAFDKYQKLKQDYHNTLCKIATLEAQPQQ